MGVEESTLEEAELAARELAAEWSYQRDDARKRGEGEIAAILDNRSLWAAGVAAALHRMADGPEPYAGRRRKRARQLLEQLIDLLDESAPRRGVDSTPRAIS